MTGDFKERQDIPGYEGLYAVTKDGRVWSYPKHRYGGGWLKASLTYQGYLRVALRKDGKYITTGTHRLVASTYIPNPHNYPQVNHLNGIKNDNRLENLEWCTRQQNMIHARVTGIYPDSSQARGKRNGQTKLSIQDVLIIKSRLLTERVCVIARDYSLAWDTIKAIKMGKSWKYIKLNEDKLND